MAGGTDLHMQSERVIDVSLSLQLIINHQKMGLSRQANDSHDSRKSFARIIDSVVWTDPMQLFSWRVVCLAIPSLYHLLSLSAW